MHSFTITVDWKTVMWSAWATWSVFWSFAPRPKLEEESWYAAIWHTAQWLSINPGQSVRTFLYSRKAAATTETKT